MFVNLLTHGKSESVANKTDLLLAHSGSLVKGSEIIGFLDLRGSWLAKSSAANNVQVFFVFIL